MNFSKSLVTCVADASKYTLGVYKNTSAVVSYTLAVCKCVAGAVKYTVAV